MRIICGLKENSSPPATSTNVWHLWPIWSACHDFYSERSCLHDCRTGTRILPDVLWCCLTSFSINTVKWSPWHRAPGLCLDERLFTAEPRTGLRPVWPLQGNFRLRSSQLILRRSLCDTSQAAQRWMQLDSQQQNTTPVQTKIHTSKRSPASQPSSRPVSKDNIWNWP